MRRVEIGIAVSLALACTGGLAEWRREAGAKPDLLESSCAVVGIRCGAPSRYTGTLYITENNIVIDGMNIVGNVVVDADNITIKNSKLTSNTPWHALRVMDGATGFTLADSEIDGQNTTVNGVLGHGTFLRNDIHGVENGINVTGQSLIQQNYIHNLQGGADAHYDGIEINGGSDIQILHNTVVNDHEQTSAIMLNNDFGGLSNIVVDNNRLIGGGYSFYLDGRFHGGAVDDSSIRITNNVIKGAHYGNLSVYDSKPVISGNIQEMSESGLHATPE